eukprot:Tamp_22082.p2 GENE.Tamp_22082~~Tamp_22082.p2  ORF type:complete len:174 (-),score=40.64 Tamp_22082:126-647(-)
MRARYAGACTSWAAAQHLCPAESTQLPPPPRLSALSRTRRISRIHYGGQLLKVHADPSIVDTTKSTALHICAKKGYADLAQALIQHCHVHRILGPNLEVFAEMTDKGGKSAHYWAREFGHHEMCETLPPKPYDPLEQFEAAIKDPENRVWQKESKKKKKGKKGGKKGGKKKKK